MPTKDNPDVLVQDWSVPSNAYHNLRVMCDLAGLSLAEKNLLCSVIYQESEFYNYKPDGTPTKNENLNLDGSLSSTDWGIAQINDYWHIAPNGNPFPSVEYVLANPQAVLIWFIQMYQQGQLYQWSSYKAGLNRQWLAPNSPMWLLSKLP